MFKVPVNYSECTQIAKDEAEQNFENYYCTTPENIYAGKLAECFIALIASTKFNPDDESTSEYAITQGVRTGMKYSDAGHDLIIGNQKIQVKTTKSSKYYSIFSDKALCDLTTFLQNDPTNIILIFQRSTAVIYELTWLDLEHITIHKSNCTSGYYIVLDDLAKSQKFIFDIDQADYVI